MLVCHCRGVTHAAIRGAIESGALTCEELSQTCAAGSRCRGCWPLLEELLAEHAVSA